MGDGRMAVGGWTMMKTRRGLCAAVNLRLMIIVSGGWLGVEWWEQVRLDEEQRGNCVKLPVVLFYLVTTLATKSKHNTIHPNEERLEGSLLTGMADKMLGSKYRQQDTTGANVKVLQHSKLQQQTLNLTKSFLVPTVRLPKQIYVHKYCK